MQLRVKKIYGKIIERDTPIWKGATSGLLFVAAVAFIGISLGMPTGIGKWFDIPLITSIAMLFIVAVSIAGAGLFTLIRLPLPRLFVSSLISIYCTLSSSLIQFNIHYKGAAFVTGVTMIIGLLLGTSFTLFSRTRKKRVLTTSYAALSLFIFIYSIVWLISPGTKVYESIRPEDSSYVPVLDSSITDPSQPGPYNVRTFTYGSNIEAYRIAPDIEIDLVTEPVDASAFLKEWHPLRSLYWGFDERNIPLEGTVWMPDGEGPFPLVLIVHGSSKMENPSDEGYDYLGELLASRGFIAVSVNQNFINYSIWTKGIDWDMTTRAWVLLQHVIMIEAEQAKEGSLFYQQVDMERLAIIGHSRGGQAAALAASFAEFYNEDHYPEISLDVNFKISAVAAIAPTDRLIDGRYIRLRDVDYFVMQGSHDSDVNTFYGDRQYRRTYWYEREGGFKASLYIEGGSHGEYNTVWGDRDTTMPTALLLNKKGYLKGEDQRQIAKVMISAFLEASLNGQRQYIDLLRDYRYALNWLPETTYVNRYADRNVVTVVDYEGNRQKHMTKLHGGRLHGEHLKKWEEQEVLSRTGYSTLNHAALLAWDGRKEARYTVRLPERFARSWQLAAGDALVFSLANAEINRLNPYKRVPKIAIEFVTYDNIVVRLPLHEFRSYPPLIHTRFTKLGLFENTVKFGNLGHSAEHVFQLYEIPLAAVSAHDAQFDLSQLSEVRFVFERGKAGKVLIDDIGFSIETN